MTHHLNLLAALVAGTAFGVTFGLVDNGLLLWSLHVASDSLAAAGQDSIGIALLGNDFSDVGGVIAGLYVSRYLRRWLRHDGECSTAQEGIGIGVGCSLVWLGYVTHWALIAVPALSALVLLVVIRQRGTSPLTNPDFSEGN